MKEILEILGAILEAVICPVSNREYYQNRVRFREMEEKGKRYELPTILRENGF